MNETHVVLHDPHGLIEAQLPLDRAPHEALIAAVLAWTEPDLPPSDYKQIVLQLTGHAHAVAAKVRHLAATLPKSSDGRAGQLLDSDRGGNEAGYGGEAAHGLSPF